MTYSYQTFNGGAAGISLAVSIPFLLRAHVSLYTDYDQYVGTYDALLVEGTDYNWVSDTLITTLASTVGRVITVKRKTPTTGLLVGWTDGSNVDMDDLLTSDRQNLYAVQEQEDASSLVVATAGLALSQVVASLPYAPVATVAAIPATPTNGQRIEIGDSAGIQSFSPLAGRPSGFVGASNLIVRLVYTTTGNTWQWVDYRAVDPDGRYGTIASVTAASTAAAAAQTTANTANTAAAAAQTTANTANTAAAAAQTTANTANTAAAAAQSFTQAGTGAVARTVESKLRDVVSVKDFGAVGNGVVDDTAAIQNAVNEAMKYGKQVLIEGPGPYCISSTIQVKVTRDLAPTDITPLSDVHFTDNTSAYVLGLGTPTLKATGSMTAMMELIFDTSDSDIGPFYSKVEGIGFDGNSLATAGIKSNYAMHVTIERNRFWNLERGIECTGYGVGKFEANAFKCTYGIYLVGGGGDSLIVANDFYPRESVDSSCIYLGYYSGNIRIFSNVFTNEFAPGFITYGIQVAGGTAAGSEEIRDLVIRDNEFCGLLTAIRADGKASGTKNIYRIIIDGNHTLPYGANNTGSFLAAVDCVQLQVNNNFCNAASLFDAASKGVELVRCQQTKLHNNKFNNYAGITLEMTDCTDSEITSNTFIDCGKLGTSYVVVPIFGSSSARNYFRLNYFRQSSASYGDYGILESTGVDYTFSFNNTFDGFNIPHVKVGANSVMRREEYAPTIPADGSYYAGDVVWNTTPSAGAAPGWVCTTSGVTFFVFKAMSNLAA